MIGRGMIRFSHVAAAAELLLLLCSAQSARAQMTTQVSQPVLDFDYSRGRNVSVTERPRPEYTSVGIPVGGFTLFPSLSLGAGYTDNSLETRLDTRSSGYFELGPDLRLVSNWSRNSLQVEANGQFRRYTETPVRNESAWNVFGSGRLNIGDDSAISASAATGQKYESRLSGGSPTDLASATPYDYSHGAIQGDTVLGRIKLTLTGSYINTTFNSVQLTDEVTVDQKYRNNESYNLVGRAEYGLTPDVSTYVELSFDDSDYDRRYAQGLNFRNSREYRGLVGVSMDLTALVRGSAAIGYGSRRYQSALYDKVQGLSFEAHLEYFPSELTTVTFLGRRVIADASIPQSSGYFNTAGGVRVDHEFLRNLLANVGIDYEQDDYRGIESRSRIFLATGGARYLISRTVGIGASVAYGRRKNTGLDVGPSFNETSGLLSIYLQK